MRQKINRRAICSSYNYPQSRNAHLEYIQEQHERNKEEIIKISHKIDTFETSILPYEDCCTVFTPKHPRTKPVLKFVEQAEQAMDMENLIDRAVKGTECLKINR